MKDVNDLARVLHEAFQIATTGRPGPVVVDIPKDVQFQKGAYVGPQSVRHRTYRPKTEPDLGADREGGRDDGGGEAAAVLHRRRHHQFRARKRRKLLRELVELTGFPITSTLMGLGAFPASRAAMAGPASACTAPTKPITPCMIAT